MKCSDAQERLSAFYDGELSSDARDSMTVHLAECERCASDYAGFEAVTRAVASSPRAKVPAAVWNGISAELDADRRDEQTEGQIVVRLRTNGQQSAARASWRRLALAASILLLVGSAIWVLRGSHSDHDHSAEFVKTMDHYLRTLPRDPDGAEQYLLDKYDGQTVNAEDAMKLVGYRPAIADGLPEGYSVVSTSVLKMPCCTCIKAACRRQDGSMLVLFEHDDEKTGWFGERPSNMAMCGDKQCCLVDLDSSIAATWKRGSRSVTAVGVLDKEEVVALVSWLDRSAASTL